MSAPSGAPAWFTAQATKTWSTPVTNTLASVGGSSTAITNAWTGGCADQVRGELILAANGGHGDYSGNEVYAVAMRNSAPAWVRLTNASTPTGGSDASNSTGQYGDGRMRSQHGWNLCTFGNGRVWYLGLSGMYQTGFNSTAVHSFNRDTVGSGPFPVANAPWVYHGMGHTGAQLSGGNLVHDGCAAAFDRIGNRAWCFSGAGAANDGSGLISVDASTGSITRHLVSGGAPAGGHWAAVAYDVSPRVLILGRKDGVIRVVNLESPTSITTVTQSGSPTALADRVGAVYHAPSRAVLCWDSSYGTSIRKLKIPTNPLTGTYTWSTVTAAGGGATPPGTLDGDFQGVYSKFNIIEDMGNGQGCLVAVCRVTGSTYAYKLPAGELT